jgi:hypothetical protein
MSSTAVRAVMAALPGARIEAAASVVSSETGRVFTRTARIRVGAGVVLLNVDAATGMFETSFTQTDDRISVQVGVDGFRVRLRSTGGRVQVTDLLRLGEDPRLVAA